MPVVDNATQPTLFESLLERARKTAEHGQYAEKTLEAHESGLKRYYAFCERAGITDPFPLNDEIAAAFVMDMSEDPRDYSPNTVRCYLQSVCTRHRDLGHLPFNRYFAGRVVAAYVKHKAEQGWRENRKAPLLQDDLVRVVGALRPANRARDLRDGCALTLGWAIFGRCSDLHWLNLDDVQIMPDGTALRVLVAKDKTDQGAKGKVVHVPAHPDTRIDPVKWTVNWIRWLDTANGIRVGPLLRPMAKGNGGLKYPGEGWAERAQIPGGRWCKRTYRHMLKTRCAAVGIPPEAIAGHSLRAGGATGAYLAGAREIEITRHGRWTDGSMSVYRYIREVDAGRMNPLHAVHRDWEARLRAGREAWKQTSA